MTELLSQNNEIVEHDWQLFTLKLDTLRRELVQARTVQRFKELKVEYGIKKDIKVDYSIKVFDAEKHRASNEYVSASEDSTSRSVSRP